MNEQELQELAELEELDKLEKEFASQAPQASNAPKAAMAGITQGATLGYTPQIVGGIASLLGRGAGPVDPRTGERMDLTNYLEARDATNKELSGLAKTNPLSYYGGAIAGGGAAALPVAGLASGVKGAAAMGAAQGLLQNPGDVEGQINPLQARERLANATLGAGVGAGAGAAASGLSKLANYLQRSGTGLQKAKLPEGQRKELADILLKRNIWGTRGGIEKQVERQLPQVEQQLNKLAAPLEVDSRDVAAAVEDAILKSRSTRGGVVPTQFADDVSAAAERAQNIAARDVMSGADALDFARLAEKGRYKLEPGQVRPGIQNELGALEGQAYKTALEKASGGGVRDLLKQEQALILARKGAQRAPSTSNLELNTGAQVGATLNNPLYPAAAVASKAPLVQTGLAQLLDKVAAPAASKLPPASLRAIFEAKRRK